MIFSKKINKISSGKNLSLYAKSSIQFDLFVFLNLTTKKELTYSNILKCSNTNNSYNYNSVIKLNDKYLCVSFDDNMSVISSDP